jgi:leader peptidase (prepilin peptidase)/N-methyltransferase
MMMAGSFLGWQPVVVAFFVSVFPALLIGIILLITRRDNSLPFGPSLALGVVITWLCWEWIAPHVLPIFFWRNMLFFLVAFGGIFMFLAGHLLGRIKGRK